ncbi:MAG: hypothetical protein PUC39_06185 [Lachnospiraceae bacterium]|nr:hypothetical protein [Lachnospiraceae bacterium]
MENKTKIVLLQAKELIYTGIFVILGIVLIIVLVSMFASGKNKSDSAKAIYEPGTYTSSIALGESSFQVCVTVSENKIENVTFDQLDETVTTMYPLLNTALDRVNEQIKETGSIDSIAFETDYQYTGTVVKQAIEAALKKAKK